MSRSMIGSFSCTTSKASLIRIARKPSPRADCQSPFWTSRRPSLAAGCAAGMCRGWAITLGCHGQ